MPAKSKAAEMGDQTYDDLDDPAFSVTEEQIGRDLDEAEADIEAGRVVSGVIVLNHLQRELDAFLKKGAVGDGHIIE